MQGDSEKKEYRLAKWNKVCGPKDRGGLVIYDQEVKNIALLGKWIFNLLNEDRVWQTLLKIKYIGSRALSQVYRKPGNSHFWADLIATMKLFFPYGSFFKIKDGSKITS
jgi:hypothetical protein